MPHTKSRNPKKGGYKRKAPKKTKGRKKPMKLRHY